MGWFFFFFIIRTEIRIRDRIRGENGSGNFKED